MKIFLIVFLPIFISIKAQAWDGSVSGKISIVDVTGGQNYGFRVSLKNSPKLCGNSYSWAYINQSDSNYQTYVSVLLAAKAMQSTVTIYTTRKGGEANGYCKMGYISMR